MSCNKGPIQSWGQWRSSTPIDPRELLANAQLQGSWGVTQGVYIDSSQFSTPPAPPSLLTVVGARVIDSTGPTDRAILTNPIMTQTVGAGDNPDRIEIDFNVSPDPLSVTTVPSITVSGVTTGPIGGAAIVIVGGGKTARLTFPFALAAGDTYIVNVNGTTAPQVKLGGVNLDGEALGLPSGTGVAGGDFCFGVQVVAGTMPAPSAAAPLPPANNWKPSLVTVTGNPTCAALESDNFLKIAEASQWNFLHMTANVNANIAQPLQKAIFLRAGEEWQMNIPLQLGYLSYSEIEIGFLSNAGTRGDCQGTIPTIKFGGPFSGAALLQVSVKQPGSYVVGIRAIDSNGYYSMYDSQWIVVE
jgi:hypothetical protein